MFEGVVLGGYISDRFVKKVGPHGRIWVLIASQLLAAPFAAGTLLLPTPWAYISLIPCYIVGKNSSLTSLLEVFVHLGTNFAYF